MGIVPRPPKHSIHCLKPFKHSSLDAEQKSSFIDGFYGKLFNIAIRRAFWIIDDEEVKRAAQRFTQGD